MAAYTVSTSTSSEGIEQYDIYPAFSMLWEEASVLAAPKAPNVALIELLDSSPNLQAMSWIYTDPPPAVGRTFWPRVWEDVTFSLTTQIHIYDPTFSLGDGGRRVISEMDLSWLEPYVYPTPDRIGAAAGATGTFIFFSSQPPTHPDAVLQPYGRQGQPYWLVGEAPKRVYEGIASSPAGIFCYIQLTDDSETPDPDEIPAEGIGYVLHGVASDGSSRLYIGFDASVPSASTTFTSGPYHVLYGLPDEVRYEFTGTVVTSESGAVPTIELDLVLVAYTIDGRVESVAETLTFTHDSTSTDGDGDTVYHFDPQPATAFAGVGSLPAGAYAFGYRLDNRIMSGGSQVGFTFAFTLHHKVPCPCPAWATPGSDHYEGVYHPGWLLDLTP